jgi:endonuclease/exonuclease/phosphatase family metal-dependent hydrolase
MIMVFSRYRAFFLIVLVLGLTACATLQEEPLPRVVIPIGQPHQGTLKVITLNMAHGRNDSFSQLFLGQADFENNLERIADLLIQKDADIIALQEADGPSRWSGGFNHVAALAEDADYPWFERASHEQSWMFDYGTALLSRQPFEEVINHTFAPSPPTMNKGLLLGQIRWQPGEGDSQTYLVDIISVHLDFSRQSVRQQQIEEMVITLGERDNPVIILGDFNSEWFSESSVVQALADRAGLQVFRPEARDLGTYKNSEKRLDWILISEELEFIDYQVLPDMISDHKATYAEIGFR